MKAAGVIDVESGTSKVLEIADAGFKLKSTDFDARTRLKALEKVERSILKLLTSDIKTEHKSFDLIREELGVEERWLREFAVRISISLDATEKPRGVFAEEVRTFLKNAEWGHLDAPTVRSIGSMYKAPSEKSWGSITHLTVSPLVPYSTIHGVKGMEFRGVVLIIPEAPKSKATEELLDAWESDLDTEARRVVYVAGSRAEELLMLAVHTSHTDRVAALLDIRRIPYERA